MVPEFVSLSYFPGYDLFESWRRGQSRTRGLRSWISKNHMILFDWWDWWGIDRPSWVRNISTPSCRCNPVSSLWSGRSWRLLYFKVADFQIAYSKFYESWSQNLLPHFRLEQQLSMLFFPDPIYSFLFLWSKYCIIYLYWRLCSYLTVSFENWCCLWSTQIWLKHYSASVRFPITPILIRLVMSFNFVSGWIIEY